MREDQPASPDAPRPMNHGVPSAPDHLIELGASSNRELVAAQDRDPAGLLAQARDGIEQAYAGAVSGEVGAETVEQLLDRINATPVAVEIGQNGTLTTIKVSLPGGCEFSGDVAGGVAKVQWLRVPQELRGHGLGKRLVRALTASLVDHKATSLYSGIRNEASLKIYANVFREENLQFYEGQNEELPISFGQAMQSLQRAGLNETDPDNRQVGIGVSVDLRRVDTVGWERPPQPEPTDSLPDYTPVPHDKWL